MKSISVLIGCLFVLVPSWAEDSLLLEKLHQAYANVSYFEAEFKQEKNIKYLSKPLISLGLIKFYPHQGMIWEIKEPIWVRTKITDAGIFKTNAFEQNVKVKDVQMQAVADIMSELLSSQLDRIKSQFELSAVTLAEDETSWQATLKPKSLLIKKALEAMRIEGELDATGVGQGISKITLTDPAGNITTISFNQLQLLTDEASPVEMPDAF